VVEQAGVRREVLDCFALTAPRVFAWHCRLTSGDARQAIEFVVETFGRLDDCRAVDGEPIDDRRLLDAAHRVYLGAAASPEQRSGHDAIATLTPDQRVAANMHALEGAPIAAVAGVLGVTAERAAAVFESAVGRLGALTSGESVQSAMRRSEVWMDDEMRAGARTSLLQRLSAPAVDALRLGVPGPSESAVRTRSGRRLTVSAKRRVAVGALVALAATAAGIVSNNDQPNAGQTSPSTPAPISPNSTPTSTQTLIPSSTSTAPVNTNPATTPSDTPADTASTTNPTAAATQFGYVVNSVPDGFIGMSVQTISPQTSGWFDVWATADAGRTSGRWIALVVAPADDLPGDVSSPPAPDGVRRTRARLPAGQRIDVESFGLTMFEIDRVIDSLTVGTDLEPAYGPAASAILDDMAHRVSRAAGFADIDNQLIPTDAQSVLYLADDASGLAFAVLSGAQSPNDLFAFELLTEHVSTFWTTFGRNIRVDGQEMLVGRFSAPFGGDPVHVIQWHDGGKTVVIYGAVDLGVLLDAAQTTRPATPAQWARFLRQ
jgi:hypothetical protein